MRHSAAQTPGAARQGLGVRSALAALAAASVLLISAGVYGNAVFRGSGFDSEQAFSAIYRAGGELSRRYGNDMEPLLEGLDAEGLQGFGALLEELLIEAWQKTLSGGVTFEEAQKMDDGRREALLDSLLVALDDPETAERFAPALSALRAARRGVADGGLPVFETWITELAPLLSAADASEALSRLDALKREQYPSVEAAVTREKGALFAEALGTRKLSRFKDNGAGLIGLSRSLHGRLLAADPGFDFSELLPLLVSAAKDDGFAASQAQGKPPGEAYRDLLYAMDADHFTGVRLLSSAQALYAALCAAVGDPALYDHTELLLQLSEIMEPEFGEALERQAGTLRASRLNGLLRPLLSGLLQKIDAEARPAAEAEKIRALGAFAEGKPAEEIERGYIGLLLARRDAEAAAAAAAFAAALPGSARERTLFSLLFALYAMDEIPLGAELKAALAALSEGDRALFRQDLLQSLLKPGAEAPEPLKPAIEGLGDAQGRRLRMQLLLSGADASGQILPAQLQSDLRQSVRQPGPRVTAARLAAEGSLSFPQQLLYSASRTIILLSSLLLADALLLAALMYGEKSWRFNSQWIIILLIADFMIVFQLLPMFHLLARAFTPGGSFSLETFKRLFSYDMNRSALVNTIVASLATMFIGTAIAFPLAWLVGRTNMHGRMFFRRLFVLTYMVPPYVGAMAWLRLLNPNVGSVNLLLRAVFGLSGETGPVNVYSMGGMIWVLSTFYFPYAFITISRAMEKMDPSLEEASRISGASPLRTLLTVTLPMMTPSVIAGALLVFVGAASAFGIPSIIGAPGRVHTVTTRIIEYYGRGTQGLNDATGLAVFLMLQAMLILYLSDFVLAKKQYITVSGKSTRPNIVDLRSWRLPLTMATALFSGVVVLLPFLTILTTSFKIDVGKAVTEAGNFTLNQWRTIFTRDETLGCLKNSLLYASVAATAGIVVACAMGFLLQRTRVRGRRLPDFLITLGSGTPSVVIALGLIMSMQGNYGVNIYNTAYILIVAYLIKYMMMGMRTVVSAMSQIHVSLEESSQISGAGWPRTMLRITGPLIFPSIAAGWFLIFIPCFYELSMTALLYSNTTKTIGFQLYEYWTYTSQPQASAMAFGILTLVVLLNLLLNRLTRGEFSI